MLRKIAPEDVKKGMFVVGFGGTWFDHPFWHRKFHVTKDADLKKLASSKVPFVLVDDSQSKECDSIPELEPIYATPPLSSAPSAKKRKALYRPSTASAKERAAKRRASKVASRSKDAMKSVFSDLRFGWRIDGKVVDRVLEDVVAEVDKDSAALLNVTRLKTLDDYTYLHSVAVCALMVSIGKRAGKNRNEIRDLGMAGLLHDVGKVSIPDTILNKRGKLTDAEFAEVKRHPQCGHDFLLDCPQMPHSALDVALHHHEKIDGTGYPFGLKKEQISYAARLGAVCDVFDALTSKRAYKAPWTLQQAVTAMWSWEGHFDRSLLIDLMHVLHVFADGLLVRLSDETLAVTLPQENQGRYVRIMGVRCIKTDTPICGKPQRIDREGKKRCIVSIEDPSDWGFENWQEASEAFKNAA